ncbi:hypothetical protein BDP27DRAFT_488473 [Rhodocollybia butyracea]|uniref:Nephrocystin 3-like N-terminal domain-containing protein n=1 Tax=Rhodocollybia butyracea TaxID=206335 RepID=A0A9P5QBX2_9AGAR|nr:hypothetical protein BDP27DRAFT_488473 [Rhodocollybia butyracea]
MDRSAHESSLLPSFFRFRSMSFFERSSDLQVYGGNFYAVAGDMNIERPVEDSWTSPSDVRVLGAQRSKPESARYTPYNALTRPWGQSNAPSSSRRLTSGTSPTTESWFTTFDYTSLPEYFPEPQPSETTVSLYPGEEQFLSLISPQAISTNPDFHTLNHTISCPPTDLRPLQIVQRGNELPSQRTEGCSEQFGIYLPDKYTTTIHGGTFVSQTRPGEKGIDKLHNVAALEALHDSADSFPQPRCHPETRTKMLEDLQEWSQETDPTSSILWLFGPAGAGKSAIMRTLSSQLQDTGRLGGCFFFKRGHPTRGNAKALFVTIAYQLALDIPWLKGPISQVVERNPSILARSIEIQLQKLISEPCRMQPDRNPLTILIDGLDECEGQNVHLEILRAIRNSFTEHFLPLRFIIASRPEAHIREMFESSFYDGVHRPFNVERSFDDVRTFFLDEFERIHHEHRQTMSTVSLPWPLPDVVDNLVRKSSGYFIYASTVIKFIDDKNYRPAERLIIIMKDQTGSDSAFEALDQLYINILFAAPIAKQPLIIPILCAITNFTLTPSFLDKLLGLENGDSRLFLRGLCSVFDVPSEENKEWDAQISAHHASFFDFLNDPKRSQNFYVGGLPDRMTLVHYFMRFARGHRFQRFCQYWDPISRYVFHVLGPCRVVNFEFETNAVSFILQDLA